MINTIKLTPDPTSREGVVATLNGKTEKGYLYEPNDIVTGKYVINRMSYDSDYTETANDGGRVKFFKTRQMDAITTATLIANLDEFNANVSEIWLNNSVKAKGIEFDGRTAFLNENGKLMLVTSERISEVPDNSTILFNTDENGKFYNVYYCPNDTLAKKYINAQDILG